MAANLTLNTDDEDLALTLEIVVTSNKICSFANEICSFAERKRSSIEHQSYL